MYPHEPEVDNVTRVRIVIVFIRIGVGICLLLLGIHLTLWTIDIVTQLINQPENISIFNNFLKIQDSQQLVNISINNERIVIDNSVAFKWVMLLLVLVVVLNVVGRAITAIFGSMVSIFTNLEIKSLKSGVDQKDNS